MPTFTTVALETFIHHGLHDSPQKPLQKARGAVTTNGGSRHLYIMPALYSTPEQAPIPENAVPHSPSPYVVNHKRRGGAIEVSVVPELPKKDGGLIFERNVDDFSDNDFVGGADDSSEEDEGFFERGALELPFEEQDCKAVGAAIEEAVDLSTKECDTRSYASVPGEFFDAIDEFASDGSNASVISCDNRIESELHASRLTLVEEIERRKVAEDQLALMRVQWERIRNLMSEAGLTFPVFPSSSDGMHLNDSFTDQISQEIFVARFVTESVGRGQARAEAEEAAATIIEMKDQEILRLRDKLLYYETVNHELSQRNLVEVARRQQERKRNRRRWLLGFLGLSVAVGASAAAYAYIPQVSDRISVLGSNDSASGASANVNF